MATLFSKARTWLPEQLQAAAGVSVSYSRSGESALDLTPWVGRTVFASNSEDGPRVIFGDRDYLIPADALTYGPPRIGDRITETVDGAALVFEVQDPGIPGEPCWRWSDPGRAVYRLHVKRVS